VCVPFKDFLIVHFCLMSCTAITEVVTRESGRFIANEIYTRHFADTPIIRLVQRGVVPEGMGDSWSVLTYERSAPTEVEPTWHNVLSSESDGAEGGMCLAPATKVGIASAPSGGGGDAYSNNDVLVVTDFPENLDAVRKLLKDLDRRPQQILLEATILRATLNEDNALGVDFNIMGGVDIKV